MVKAITGITIIRLCTIDSRDQPARHRAADQVVAAHGVDEDERQKPRIVR